MITRTLSPEQAARYKRLCALVGMLDESVAIPGTNQKVGFDGIIGLVPVVGDVITSLVAAYIIREAASFGLPKWVLWRMVFNLGVDLIGGAVPLAGDVFDLIWKANKKNLALLKKHLKAQGYLDEGKIIDI